MHHLYSSKDIKQIDQLAVEHISMEELIDEVGVCLAQWFVKNIPKNQRLIVLCGPGNNGKDGQALAKHLASLEYKVESVLALKENSIDFAPYDVVVDAVFGISIDREIPRGLATQMKEVNSLDKTVIAIDVPSGVDANTGKIWGQTFRANITLTIGGLKRGLYLSPALEYVGEVVTIEVPTLKPYFEKIKASGSLLQWQKAWLEKIKPKTSDHKYSRGKLSVVMGANFPGAALLAAYAAQKIGAGYVQIFAPKNLVDKCRIEHPSFVFKEYSSIKNLRELLSVK